MYILEQNIFGQPKRFAMAKTFNEAIMKLEKDFFKFLKKDGYSDNDIEFNFDRGAYWDITPTDAYLYGRKYSIEWRILEMDSSDNSIKVLNSDDATLITDALKCWKSKSPKLCG